MQCTVDQSRQRFLPAHLADETVSQEPYWTYLVHLLDEEARRALAALPN